jgi:hypothetical protein
MNKKTFLEHLGTIASAQSDAGIFPETNRLAKLDAETSEAVGLDDPEDGQCYFCKQEKPQDELEIEESGHKICWDCVARYDEQERKAEEKRNKKETKLHKVK